MNMLDSIPPLSLFLTYNPLFIIYTRHDPQHPFMVCHDPWVTFSQRQVIWTAKFKISPNEDKFSHLILLSQPFPTKIFTIFLEVLEENYLAVNLSLVENSIQECS